MDIYEYAKSINYGADYYDMHTGYTYLIQNYGNTIKSGFPSPGIAIADGSGNIIGYAKENNKSIKEN